MKINVTQKHIDSGRVANCFSCPLALALTEALSEPCWVGLTLWGKVSNETKFNLQRGVIQFRRNFDDGEPVKPFSFEVDL